MLEPLIHCIGETDPTGQTFRYSYSTEAKKHLTDVSVINVLVLRDFLIKKLSRLKKKGRRSGPEFTDW